MSENEEIQQQTQTSLPTTPVPENRPDEETQNTAVNENADAQYHQDNETDAKPSEKESNEEQIESAEVQPPTEANPATEEKLSQEEIPSTVEPVGEEVSPEAEPVGEEAPPEAEPVGEEVPPEAELVSEEVPSKAEPVGEEVPPEAEPVFEEGSRAEEAQPEPIQEDEEGVVEAPVQQESDVTPPTAETVPNEVADVEVRVAESASKMAVSSSSLDEGKETEREFSSFPDANVEDRQQSLAEEGVISAEKLDSKDEIDFQDEVITEPEKDTLRVTPLPPQPSLEEQSSLIVAKSISSAHDQLSAETSALMTTEEAVTTAEGATTGGETAEEEEVTASTVEVPPAPSIPEDSAIDSAIAEDTMKSKSVGIHPLNFEWTFGFNRRISCLNLTDDSRNVVLFASSHVTVLYDYKNNTQKLLQGHGNAVACMASSEDKRWLVTGEKGPDSCVIIWDTYTAIPVQVIFDIPGNNGVISVGMSSDAKYMVTVNAGTPQSVSVWDWTSSVESPIHYVALNDSFQPQNYVAFHPYNNQLFVTNGESQIIFFCWETGKLEHYSPFLADTTFNKTVGTFSQTIFQAPNPLRVLTATSQGNIAVWDPERPDKKKALVGTVPSHRKRVLKLVRVMDRGITALSQTDDFVVAGNTQGHVTFFDEQLNLIISYMELNIGAVTGISFKYDPDFDLEPSEKDTDYPLDSTIAAKRFVARDFIVSTKTAEIVHVKTSGTRVSKILWEHDAAVNALAACPNKPWIAIGSYAGLLKLWDYEKKKNLVTRVFDGRAKIRSLAFSHNGLQIAVGMSSGAVNILDSISLINDTTFHYARGAITHCAFSHNSKYLATADEEFTTTVFVYINNMIWKYLGRYRAHYKPIKDIAFGIDVDLNQPRLLTLGQDRILVEYDLASSSKDDLKLLSVDRIEQSATPLCLAWYPPVTKESFLLTANDQYKMKLYNTTTKMCRKTLLGPTYGSPAAMISVIPSFNSDPTKDRLLCYATNNKVGLQLLPLDGNPHRSTSCIAHPGGISAIACGYDGNHVFTAGGRETTVHMWNINKEALEGVAALGGEELTPFYGLLDGGKEGPMFAELENYFYYAQLRSQGINTTEERQVSCVVPLDQVPFIMRALGFYPSEQEIEDMLNEVKFGEYVETGQYVTEIDLPDFIKLYVNHRPAFGLSPNELYHAFEVLGLTSEDKEPAVDRSTLLSVLQRKGEHMTEHELADCLATLLGHYPEGGSIEHGEALNHEEAIKGLDATLPESITPSLFAGEVLGLNLYESASTTNT